MSSFSSPMSSNPSQMLNYLRAASSSVVSAGRERVGGVETTHYRAQLDLSKVPDAVPSADRAAVQHALSAMEQQLNVSTIPVDVWIDAHHLVRPILMSFSGNAAGQTLTQTIEMDVFDYGPQPRPTLPPADQVATLGG
jgi:hypothetical protein